MTTTVRPVASVQLALKADIWKEPAGHASEAAGENTTPPPEPMVPALPKQLIVKGEPTVNDGGEKVTLVSLLELADKVSCTVSDSETVVTVPASL